MKAHKNLISYKNVAKRPKKPDKRIPLINESVLKPKKAIDLPTIDWSITFDVYFSSLAAVV